ncbi:MAG: HAD family hydrolase [Magnetovibrio sp.]|nr:HAD family hydrolase [Magnetovibrio sp.]
MNTHNDKGRYTPHSQLERWKRFQEAAHGEKSWINDRMSWMLVAQGFLFAALAWIMNPQKGSDPDQLKNIAAIISMLGASIALIGFGGALAAGRMHYLWTTKLNKIAIALPNEVTFGLKPHWPARTTSVLPAVAALAFFFTWVGVVCVIPDINKQMFWGVIVASTFIVVIFISWITSRSNARPPKIKAVFFDVDGVLLNSLPEHIKACEQLNAEYTLDLSIPNAKEFKNKIVRAGIQVAPMRRFFEAVKFPENHLDDAVTWYDEYFSEKYSSPYFEGVECMITELHGEYMLGIVTSNVQKNIENSLAHIYEMFEQKCIFTEDVGLSKSEAIKLGASRLGISTNEVLFIGDQERDREAAETAAANFLGVAYGWQFSRNDQLDFTLVNTPNQIVAHIRKINCL